MARRRAPALATVGPLPSGRPPLCPLVAFGRAADASVPRRSLRQHLLLSAAGGKWETGAWRFTTTGQPQTGVSPSSQVSDGAGADGAWGGEGPLLFPTLPCLRLLVLQEHCRDVCVSVCVCARACACMRVHAGVLISLSRCAPRVLEQKCGTPKSSATQGTWASATRPQSTQALVVGTVSCLLCCPSPSLCRDLRSGRWRGLCARVCARVGRGAAAQHDLHAHGTHVPGVLGDTLFCVGVKPGASGKGGPAGPMARQAGSSRTASQVIYQHQVQGALYAPAAPELACRRAPRVVSHAVSVSAWIWSQGQSEEGRKGEMRCGMVLAQAVCLMRTKGGAPCSSTGLARCYLLSPCLQNDGTACRCHIPNTYWKYSEDIPKACRWHITNICPTYTEHIPNIYGERNIHGERSAVASYLLTPCRVLESRYTVCASSVSVREREVGAKEGAR